MPVRINGATSGSTTIAAPDTGSDETIVLSTALASKADYPSGGSNGDLLTKSGTTTAWATPLPVGWNLVASETLSTLSSVSINNCFTSSNAQYAVVWRLSTSSATDSLLIRLRASGSDNSSANYASQRFTSDTTSSASIRDTSQTAMRIGTVLSGGLAWGYFFLYGPQLAAATTALAFDGIDVVTPALRIYAATHNVSTAFDGFTFFPGSGTITGNIRVYGLQNS